MTMYLRRRVGFSAGTLRPPGGHNYLCELTVGGEIDDRTGMVVNIKAIDAVMKTQIVAPLDGTLIDRDIASFQKIPPTAENLALFIWSHCVTVLPSRAFLARVALWPTNTARIEAAVNGPKLELPMLTVTRSYDFSASHRLHAPGLTDEENSEIFGKCNWSNGHGHNYEVEVTLSGDVDPDTGELYPLALLDRIVDEEVLKPYDHRHLNYDAPEFRNLNPTSENLTRVIWDKLAGRIADSPNQTARLYKVVVRETERNYFEYYGAG